MFTKFKAAFVVLLSVLTLGVLTLVHFPRQDFISPSFESGSNRSVHPTGAWHDTSHDVGNVIGGTPCNVDKRHGIRMPKKEIQSFFEPILGHQYLEVFEIRNFCLMQGGPIMLFENTTKKIPKKYDHVHSEIGTSVKFCMASVVPTDEWYDLEDAAVWILPVTLRDAGNIGHTMYKVVGALNAMEKIVKDVEVIFHIPPSIWGRNLTTMYAQLAPILAPKCRSVHAFSAWCRNVPVSWLSSPKRCFRRGYLGWENKPILKKRQNTTLLAARFESLLTSLPSHPQGVLIAARSSSRGRAWANTSGLVNALRRVYPHAEIRFVDFEQLSILSQAAHVRWAWLFIGTHGSALAWGFMLQSGATLVEVCPGSDVTTATHECRGIKGRWYSNMLRLGVTYMAYIPRPEEIPEVFDQKLPEITRNYSIDVDSDRMTMFLRGKKARDDGATRQGLQLSPPTREDYRAQPEDFTPLCKACRPMK